MHERRSHRDVELEGDVTARDRPPTSRVRAPRTNAIAARHHHGPARVGGGGALESLPAAPKPSVGVLAPLVELSTRLSREMSTIIHQTTTSSGDPSEIEAESAADPPNLLDGGESGRLKDVDA